MKTNLERLSDANELIKVIGSCGRRFFYENGRFAYMEIDTRGRIWFIDDHTGKRIYTHPTGFTSRWRGFTHGGTLRAVIEKLRDYISTGKQLHPRTFGPYPNWLGEGDPWGYGGDMEQVRATAVRLGIIKEPTA